MKPRHTSELTVVGRVIWQQRIAAPTPTLCVVLDSSEQEPLPHSRARKQTFTPTSASRSQPFTDASVDRNKKYGNNRLEIRFPADWALQLDALREGDVLALTGFDVFDRPLDLGCDVPDAVAAVLKGIPFYAVPNGCSIVEIDRRQLLSFTAGDMTARSNDVVKGYTGVAHVNSAVPAPLMNTFSNVHRYYDAMFGTKEAFDPTGRFLERIVSSQSCSVLDVGCGTGLAAFFLAYCGIPPVCVDRSHISKEIIAEKNLWFENGSPADAVSAVPFFLADISDSNFQLGPFDEHGRACPEQFDVILCLDVLAYLPSKNAMMTALKNITMLAGPDATMLVTLPNLDFWALLADKGIVQRPQHFDINRKELSVGCSSAIRRGVLDVVERVKVSTEFRGGEGDRNRSDHDSAWEHDLSLLTEWRGYGQNLRSDDADGSGGFYQSTSNQDEDGSAFSGTDNGSFYFIERFTQKVYPPAVFESIVTQLGWRMVALYASPCGRAFHAGESHLEPVRCYMLQYETHRDALGHIA